jgi:hypothetical protein
MDLSMALTTRSIYTKANPADVPPPTILLSFTSPA